VLPVEGHCTAVGFMGQLWDGNGRGVGEFQPCKTVFESSVSNEGEQTLRAIFVGIFDSEIIVFTALRFKEEDKWNLYTVTTLMHWHSLCSSSDASGGNCSTK
jgi:hypothetical protein